MPVLAMDSLKVSTKPEAARLLTEISRRLASKNNRAYIVGGFVRDALSERDNEDIDIAVTGDALEIARDMAEVFYGKYIPLDDLDLVGRVVLPGNEWIIDFTSLKGNDILEDLSHRDFTIDAIAVELTPEAAKSFTTDNLIDPHFGYDDLKNRVLRAVHQDIFTEDATRLLRAFRIAAELNFDIEPSTTSLITRDARYITGVAGERIREEFVRVLSLPGAGRYLSLMDKLSLLTALIPELAPARGVDQPHAHYWDVLEHSLQTVNALDYVLREADWDYGNPSALEMVPSSVRLQGHFNREISAGSTAKTVLKLAALLHDIAKPQTKFMEDGHARFFGHPEKGAVTATAILERLRFSRKEIQLAELLIKYHLRPTQMSNFGMPTGRAVYRFFRDLGEAGIDVLYLSLADHLAARGPALDPDEFREHARIAAYVIEKYYETSGPSAPPQIIDGNEIMEILQIPPGRVIGQLREALREAQAAGEIKDRNQAAEYLKDLYSRKYKNLPINLPGEKNEEKQ